MPLSTRSNNTRTQEITNVLRTEILRNLYRPGERLPSERDLAARFNTNRSTIREVLKGLQQLGIINIQLGGARVVAKEEATLEILDYLLDLDGYPNPKLVDDYLQVFKMICIMSAEISIQKANDQEIATIIDIINKMTVNPTDEETMREGWTNLFDYFLTISDNLVVRLVSNGLKGQFLAQKSSVEVKPTLDEKMMLKILNTMLSATQKRDSKQMGTIVEEYFEWVRKAFAEAFAAHSFDQQQAVGNK